MTTMMTSQLAEFIRSEKESLLAAWRQAVRQLPSAKDLDVPALNDHIPELLEELAQALDGLMEGNDIEAWREGTPPAHGMQRFEDGFDITEVVSEYNILRGCLHARAEAQGIVLQGRSFHVLNRALDASIGLAVKTHAEQHAQSIKQRREEYLAFVAHDLRNPLSAISLAAGALESSDGSTSERIYMLRSLQRNVSQLQALVDKVLQENNHLDTEAGLKLHPRNFDLWPHVEATIQAIRPVAAATATSVINEVPFDQVVYADASLLRRVFQNLLSNAVKYASGGEIRIGAQSDPDRHLVECWVMDNGSGIDPARLATVFEKGEGDQDHESSTGLGLAIVRTFVEEHCGVVHAESGEGQGTTIRFTLPNKERD